jgi:hypothetical protein
MTDFNYETALYLEDIQALTTGFARCARLMHALNDLLQSAAAAIRCGPLSNGRRQR